MKISIEQLCFLDACCMKKRIQYISKHLGRVPTLTELIDIKEWLASDVEASGELPWLLKRVAPLEYQSFGYWDQENETERILEVLDKYDAEDTWRIGYFRTYADLVVREHEFCEVLEETQWHFWQVVNAACGVLIRSLTDSVLLTAVLFESDTIEDDAEVICEYHNFVSPENRRILQEYQSIYHSTGG